MKDYSIIELIHIRNYISNNVENVPKNYINSSRKILNKLDQVICELINSEEFKECLDSKLPKTK